jgi:hypothetical protein
MVAIVIADQGGRTVKLFVKGPEAAQWKVTSRVTLYLEIGDLITDSCLIITAVHSSCASNAKYLVLKTPQQRLRIHLVCIFGSLSTDQSICSALVEMIPTFTRMRIAV